MLNTVLLQWGDSRITIFTNKWNSSPYENNYLTVEQQLFPTHIILEQYQKSKNCAGISANYSIMQGVKYKFNT